MSPDLDARIRRLEDRAELEDLVIRYFMAADDDDYDALGDTFAANGSFSAGGFPGGTTREEVVDFIREDRKSMGVTVHTQNSTLLTFTGDDTASGVVAAHLELARGGTSLFGAVRYLDDYVREDGRWRILKREMLAIHVGPWTEMETSLTVENRVRWPGYDPMPADLPVA
jgi:hypothetical protein